MKVRSTKDLVVAGLIKSADVEAGGDVFAKKGIIGPAALGAWHTCRVMGRNIRTHYVQHAELEAEAEDEERRRQVAKLVAGCRVTATVRIHGRVELVCLDARHRFGSDRGAGTLGVRDGNWVALGE